MPPVCRRPPPRVCSASTGTPARDAGRACCRAARRLGYTPNGVARALVSRATQTVGLVVGDIENPFFAAVARGLSDVVERAGLHGAAGQRRRGSRARSGGRCEALRSRRVDGLVVVPGSGARPTSSFRDRGPAAGAARPSSARRRAPTAVMVDNARRRRPARSSTWSRSATAASAWCRTRPRSAPRPSGWPATGGRCARCGLLRRVADLDRRLDPGRRPPGGARAARSRATGRPRSSPPTTS